MDDLQIDALTVLLAKHIVDAARSDECVALALRGRLLNIACDCDEDTRTAINLIIDDTCNLHCLNIH